jgi:Fe2+ or Zn2+ uptake regulation protein
MASIIPRLSPIPQVSPLRTILLQHRLSFTAARQQVFEVLASNEPLTMTELAERCVPNIDRASVYRTIALFEQLAIVRRLQIGWKYKIELSDAFQAHHHHLTCLGCSSVTTLPEDVHIEKQLVKLASQYGYSALDHQLEIRGYCPGCQANSAITDQSQQ